MKLGTAGSYSSAEAKNGTGRGLAAGHQTVPPWSIVAVWLKRAAPRDAVDEKVPVAGSYSSAEPSSVVQLVVPLHPPVMSTLPLFSNVAEWWWRGVTSEPVAVNAPVRGSYTSAEPSVFVPSWPPTSSTFPVVSSVAVS